MYHIILILSLLPSLLLAESNVALGKKATQSSNYDGNALAGRAIDGNSDGSWAGSSIACTNIEAQPWWQVDLTNSVVINKIKVHNRLDCCPERLVPFVITLFDQYMTFIAQTTFYGTQDTYSWSFKPVLARYVKIQLVGTNYLTIAEVEVLEASTNLALGKTATQSSNYDPKTPASLAVDGNSGGEFWKSVACTNIEAGAWWRVDLGSPSSVAQVIVHNRADCCPERLSNFVVILQDSNGANNVTSSPFFGNQNSYSWTFLPVANVRYVKVQLQGTNYLTIAEVEVLGAGVPINVAIGKTSYQTTNYVPNTPASLANDGNTGGQFWYSVACTAASNAPYWEVDFGVSQDVSKVILWNRGDCCPERLQGATVTFYDYTNKVLASTTLNGGPQNQITWSRHTYDVRKVRVALSGSSVYLTLAEVEVYNGIVPNLNGIHPGSLADNSEQSTLKNIAAVLSTTGGIIGIAVASVLTFIGLVLAVVLLVRSKIASASIGSSELYTKMNEL